MIDVGVSKGVDGFVKGGLKTTSESGERVSEEAMTGACDKVGRSDSRS